jgi:hypothetical protein
MVSTKTASGDAVVSGAGWAIASVALFAAATAGVDRSAVATLVTALLLGGLVLGLPLYTAAARTGGWHPQLEAAAWTALAAAATVLFFAATRADPSPVNAVTLDRGAGAVSPYWPYPPELVWGIRCLALFALTAGLASAALNSRAADLVSVLWRGLAFGICIAVILVACLVAFVISGPIVWKIVPLSSVGVVAAAFVSGYVAGAGLSSVRAVLITPLSGL